MTGVTRKQISLETKLAAFSDLDRGLKQTEVAEEYGFGQPTLETFIKKRKEIEDSVASGKINSELTLNQHKPGEEKRREEKRREEKRREEKRREEKRREEKRREEKRREGGGRGGKGREGKGREGEERREEKRREEKRREEREEKRREEKREERRGENLLSKNFKVRIYKIVILQVVLCGFETWTLTLREEQRLRVFENKVLGKIFGAKRDEVTGEWRKLHNAELHALYSSPDIIRNIKSRRLRWAEHVARMGESRNAYRVLVGRPEGKRPLGRPRRRWEDNIKMDLREVGYDDRDWINLAQDRDRWRAYVRAAMSLRVS
ncbi:hypothetical protein ANN_00575 [Periplaneta americana]|uniref:Uncharacterized protein n=1 Tax=Periplaneta americana TaxID=6978 RepID=A0ABQ8TUE3_PERAM|nr:hypothetical protein ANN_00575 [Periplaneta americana]